jgi:hypothetical protein
MDEGRQSTRRWRWATVLALGVVIGVLVSATPAGAHFQASIDQTVTCPNGWQARDGAHGKSTGWWGAVRNNDPADAVFIKVSVICAK